MQRTSSQNKNETEIIVRGGSGGPHFAASPARDDFVGVRVGSIFHHGFATDDVHRKYRFCGVVDDCQQVGSGVALRLMGVDGAARRLRFAQNLLGVGVTA